MAATKTKPRPWTPADDAVMGRDYGRLTTSALAERLGRSNKAISDRARKLGLSSARPVGDRLPGGPLADAVERWIDREPFRRADIVSSVTLAGWRDGSVRGDVADRWLCRMGLLWFGLWPDDDAARMYFQGPEA